MFQTNAEFLQILGKFLWVGVFIAVIWDIFRIVRLIFSGGKVWVFITDFFLTILTALLMLFFSFEIGSGKLRGYYFLAAGIGAAVYFFTVGFLTRFIAVLLGKLVSAVKKSFILHIYNPIVMRIRANKQKMFRFFDQKYQKISNNVKKSDFRLKNHRQMLYNNKIGKIYRNGGEEKNVIKAKVRKKA